MHGINALYDLVFVSCKIHEWVYDGSNQWEICIISDLLFFPYKIFVLINILYIKFRFFENSLFTVSSWDRNNIYIHSTFFISNISSFLLINILYVISPTKERKEEKKIKKNVWELHMG